MTRSLALCAAGLALIALPARAGEAACWFENGVVVVGAQVMGVSGDYILDTATPHTQLAETQAQTAGFDETDLTGDVRLAGVRIRAQSITVADIDLRTGALPTPIAGVIGADVLRGYVLDVRFSPCRVALHRPGRAPAFKASRALQITWAADRPVVRARVSDGVRTLTGGFSPGVGVDRAVRISDVRASAPGAGKLREVYPFGVLKPRLAGLTFAGETFTDLPAGLTHAENPALAGEIGAPLLSRYRLRFDFPAGRLRLAPAD